MGIPGKPLSEEHRAAIAAGQRKSHAKAKRAKQKPRKPGMGYPSLSGAKWPPGYSNIRVVATRKTRNADEIVVVIQAERRIKL